MTQRPISSSSMPCHANPAVFPMDTYFLKFGKLEDVFLCKDSPNSVSVSLPCPHLVKKSNYTQPQANIWCVGRTGKKTPYTFSNAPTTPPYYVWAKKLWMVPIPKLITNHAWPINHAKHNVQRNSCLESQQWCHGLWYWYNPANHEQCVALECRMVLRMTK